MGKAVVSTTIGAEGLPVTPGQNIVIADDPVQFADAIVRLIREDDTRRRIETEARQLVVEKYDWSAVARDFEDALAVCGEGVVAPASPRLRRGFAVALSATAKACWGVRGATPLEYEVT